jgi:quercetin dioxygenase-like cupin family protein
MSTQLQAGTPYALAPGEGKKLVWFTSEIMVKASDAGAGAVEVAMAPGEEPPLHVHSNEDEWFYLIEGDMAFHVGGEALAGVAGSFVSFPRGIPHTFEVLSDSARFIVFNTPGGFERMFELAPTTPEEAGRAMAEFGMEIVGPHPRETR